MRGPGYRRNPLLVLMPVLLLNLVCAGGSELNSSSERDGGHSSVDVPADLTSGLDSEVSPDGRRVLGAILCCASGEGTACCPGGGTSFTCQPYGGSYRRCIGAGEIYEGKVACALCCDGLVRKNLDEPEPATGSQERVCTRDAPPSLLICIRCGDGVCGAGENSCRCPADCPS